MGAFKLAAGFAGRRQQQELLLDFHGFLRQVYEENEENIIKGPFAFEKDVQVYLVGEGCTNPVEGFWNSSSAMFVLEKRRPQEETSQPEEQEIDTGTCIPGSAPEEDSAPLALPLSRARQLISFYTMSQNPNMTHLKISNPAPLPPLWVRCDRSDPQQTIWLGAEPLITGNKLTGIHLHTVTCNGPVSFKCCSADLKELKEAHRTRHRSSDLTVKGFACYEFLEAATLDYLALEDTLIALERHIFADFSWDTVTKILQAPPLTSAAELKVQIASGSPLSPVYELNRELQFLLSLAESLKIGTTDWPKPQERKPAADLVQKLLKDVKDEIDGVKTPDSNETESPQNNTAAVYSSMKTPFISRGDLDFAEQLWCKIWKNVASYEDLVNCFTLIMKSLQSGELQVWIHQGSNSLLSKLIKQSYHGSIEAVSLSGDTPVRMLLEIGVDKMKRDYVSYFVGKELAIHSHLEYFMSTSVDLQEQVNRVQKLHHMLEIVGNCVELLKLEHENLPFLTQSCVNYYKENPLNEKHVFQLPVRATFAKEFCQNVYPQVWRAEISSGQGQQNVKTVWQMSTTPPAEHPRLSRAGLLDETGTCDSKEERCFITLAQCSQSSLRGVPRGRDLHMAGTLPEHSRQISPCRLHRKVLNGVSAAQKSIKWGRERPVKSDTVIGSCLALMRNPLSLCGGGFLFSPLPCSTPGEAKEVQYRPQ
ncbi:protein zwilch homolog isoform X3 [Hemicordylus capensis]|uniref:protein zwilch homolog isoform X3 n=1 Tax=Hemicordylus capensis TaxID=884348 RepID=UPI002303FC7A|nr:protein zwilch homolog isoform X3 [Hemicordylus capensis]